MSRIGNQPITLPPKVKVGATVGTVDVEGPRGKLSLKLHPRIELSVDGDTVHVKRKDDEQETRALHGLMRSLVANMVTGVTSGFTRELEINGVGYRAEVKGHALHLALGFSHPVVFELPKGVNAQVDAKRTRITLDGVDKQLLGVTAAKIRSFRPPEPYLGKGVRYADEVVRRKEGKSAGK